MIYNVKINVKLMTGLQIHWGIFTIWLYFIVFCSLSVYFNPGKNVNMIMLYKFKRGFKGDKTFKSMLYFDCEKKTIVT